MSKGQILIFFWASMSLRFLSTLHFFKKNQFFGPSRGTALRPLFLFCSSVFSSFFFFFFLDIVLLFFPFFCFFKNVFLYFLFRALVSEFNCFFHSRCSMKMWCPDDVGRDSWDWVGPPAWRRACFNSPEWGGGSSPVETEPLQIVLLLLLFL